MSAPWRHPGRPQNSSEPKREQQVVRSIGAVGAPREGKRTPAADNAAAAPRYRGTICPDKLPHGCWRQIHLPPLTACPLRTRPTSSRRQSRFHQETFPSDGSAVPIAYAFNQRRKELRCIHVQCCYQPVDRSSVVISASIEGKPGGTAFQNQRPTTFPKFPSLGWE